MSKDSCTYAYHEYIVKQVIGPGQCQCANYFASFDKNRLMLLILLSMFLLHVSLVTKLPNANDRIVIVPTT